MARIHQRNSVYEFLLSYITWCFRRAYRKVEYRGLENIPSEGALILSPNHANTLMDAIAVLSIKDKPVVFVARADIFRKKTARQFLNFIKILPINRIRDGVEALKENDAIIDQCVETLVAGVPFCILPEGTHRTQHSLLPLRKGIARIAYETYGRIKDNAPICIVPVGLEYGDYFDYRSTLLITIGKPIILQDFIAERPGLEEQQQMRQLLLLLEERMKENIIYIPSDENYEQVWEETNIQFGRQKKRGLYFRMRWMQNAAKKIGRRGDRLSRAGRVNAFRKKRGISLESISDRRTPLQIGLCITLLLLTLPLFLLSALLLWPALLTTAIIKSSLKDKAFLNSIRFVACSVVNPLVMLIVCLALLPLLPWWLLLTVWLLSFPFLTPAVFYDWIREFRRTVSDIRLKSSEKELEI